MAQGKGSRQKARMKKIPWGKGPVIKRIKLNPEQAILACCDFARGKVFHQSNLQCNPWPSCGYAAVTACIQIT